MFASTDRRARRGEGGFLLLEALIGLAIVGLVAIGLLAATASQVRTADKAAVLLVAGALAQDRLVSLQMLDQEALRDPPDSLLAGVFPEPFQEYTWEAQVVEAEDEYDLFAVRLEVKGRGEAYPLETLLHRPPVVMATAAAQQGQGGRGGQAGGRAGGGGGGGDAEGRGGGGGRGPGAGPGAPPGGRGGGVQGPARGRAGPARGAVPGGGGGGGGRAGRAGPPPGGGAR